MANLMFVEPDKHGAQHEAINKANIALFSSVFPKSTISFFCEKVHFSLVGGKGGWVDFPVPAKYGLKKYLWSIVSIFLVVKGSRKIRPQVLVFLSLNPLQYLLTRLLSPLIVAERVFVICHGELKSLSCSSGGVAGKLLYLAFLFRSQRLLNTWTYVLLSKKISVPNVMCEKIVKLNHPMIFKSASLLKSRRKNLQCLNIGHIGIASISKGSDNFFKMASRFKGDKRFKFSVTGKVDASMLSFKGGEVDADFSGDFVDRRVVEENLASLDLAVFIYDETYADVPSGALMEAINYRIPSLVLRNSYIEYLISSGVETFRVFESVDDIEVYIQSIDLTRNLDFNFDFDFAQSFFSVAHAIRDLRGVL